MAVLLIGTVFLFPEPTTVAGSRGEPLFFNYVRDMLYTSSASGNLLVCRNVKNNEVR